MWQKVRLFMLKPTVPFQVLSDLHLEIDQQYGSYDFPVRAKHLVLAGDVGRLIDYDGYRTFLQKQTDRFEHVYLVLGNHEFYGLTFADGLEKARALENEPCMNGRLILLHQRQHKIPGSDVVVLGCTLWSDIPSTSADIVRYRIQDFNHIHDWSVDNHNAAHAADLSWLLQQLESIEADKTGEKGSVLIVTHHAPSLKGTSSPQHENNPWSVAFGTDILARVPKGTGVKAWVFGHTHYTTEFKRQGIRVVSNQRGYVLPWMNRGQKRDRFDAEKVIHL